MFDTFCRLQILQFTGKNDSYDKYHSIIFDFYIFKETPTTFKIFGYQFDHEKNLLN
jgi:hypothetical protein